ncbi:MAG: hypothetical protein H6607_12110 [Flavobacteriales bacterium]|nr:hypothetical protein [Flavobacteriales bacterium]
MRKWKQILILIFPNVLAFQTRAQIILEQAFDSTITYSQYYLDTTNRNFLFLQSDCTTEVIGRGIYKQINDSFIFQFQPLDRQADFDYELDTNRITIEILDWCLRRHDERISMEYNDSMYSLDSAGVVVLNYWGGKIIVESLKTYGQMIELSPEYSWETHIMLTRQLSKKVTLRQTGEHYMLKRQEKFYRENRLFELRKSG